MPVEITTPAEEKAENDLGDLLAASHCFHCLSQKQKLAVKLWIMATINKAEAGEDFTTPNLMSEVTSCWKCEPSAILDSVEVAIFRELGIDLGAISPTMTTQEMVNQSKCFMCMDPIAMRAAYAFILHELIEIAGGTQ